MTDDEAYEIQKARDEYRDYMLAAYSPYGSYRVIHRADPGIDWQNLHESEGFNYLSLIALGAMLIAIARSADIWSLL